MNKFFPITLFVFFALLFCEGFLFAEPVSINGLQFSADSIRIVTPDNGKPSFLALDFGIYNLTDTRKFDLPADLKFSLEDEFGNIYSRIKSPDGNLSPARLASSIYPKTDCRIPLGFELPVAKATKAVLRFDGVSLGIKEPIHVSFSLPSSVGVMSLRIIAPENGAVVQRGMLVHLMVTVAGPRLPDGIVLDAFNYTYEDRTPTSENIYDLNVPGDYAIGPQGVNVIAKWNNADGKEATISSDNIVLNVTDSSQMVAF